MTKEEVLKNLCCYDKRNPDNCCIDNENKTDTKKEVCYCDNCFYGLDILAEEILKLREELKK